jgi:hypothetical protein
VGLLMLCALYDERTGLYFTITAGLASAISLGPSGTQDDILSHIPDSPNLEVQVPVLKSHRNRNCLHHGFAAPLHPARYIQTTPSAPHSYTFRSHPLRVRNIPWLTLTLSFLSSFYCWHIRNSVTTIRTVISFCRWEFHRTPARGSIAVA